MTQVIKASSERSCYVSDKEKYEKACIGAGFTPDFDVTNRSINYYKISSNLTVKCNDETKSVNFIIDVD